VRNVGRGDCPPVTTNVGLSTLTNRHLMACDGGGIGWTALAYTPSKETGEVTIEPVHEALLRQWGLLQGWLAEDAGLLGVLEGVKRASRDWPANNKDSAWLTLLFVTGLGVMGWFGGRRNSKPAPRNA
jgi:hypothetical protein